MGWFPQTLENDKASPYGGESTSNFFPATIWVPFKGGKMMEIFHQLGVLGTLVPLGTETARKTSINGGFGHSDFRYWVVTWIINYGVVMGVSLVNDFFLSFMNFYLRRFIGDGWLMKQIGCFLCRVAKGSRVSLGVWSLVGGFYQDVTNVFQTFFISFGAWVVRELMIKNIPLGFVKKKNGASHEFGGWKTTFPQKWAVLRVFWVEEMMSRYCISF